MPKPHFFRARSIVEAHGIANQIENAKPAHSRIEDAYQALQWRLARDPKVGTTSDGTYWLHRQLGGPSPDVPGFLALYKFDDNNVDLLALLVEP